MHILKLHVDICVIQINKKLKLKKVGRKQKFPNKFLVRVGLVQFSNEYDSIQLRYL